MIKYIKATSSGKGFITHADRETSGLNFENMPDSSIWKVTGEATFVDAWATRVGGTEITETAAAELNKAASLAGANQEKNRLENELAAVATKISELT
jgi:hypothetical protein